MIQDDTFAFLIAACVAGAVILTASSAWSPPAPGAADPPKIGLPADEQVIGPPSPPVAAQDETPDPVAARALEVVRSRPWPAFVKRVVFHPIAGAALPGADLEQGPPYHLVIDAAGAVTFTKRGEAGAPGQPADVPVKAAVEAWHVALPDALRATPARIAAARAVWREATARLGAGGALFVDEIAGSGRIPEGFDRAPYVAAAETRPESAASRPARLRIRFGTGTIDAGIAGTRHERREGLMGRTSLAAGEGLLFVYRKSDYRSYWMKGMRIPLDILYVKDDGEVIAIGTFEPARADVPDDDLPRFTSPAACRLVLEVAAGSARAHGVKVGSRLGLPPSVEALFDKADP